MPKGRKSGCPVNVRDWKIEIQDKSQVNETWITIHGVNTLNRQWSSTTEDGSAATDTWEEPYVTKRSGTITMNADPVVDAETGEPDAGQDLLDAYAENVGCDGDATIRITDPWGHRTVGDYIVSGKSNNAGESENELSWDLSQVGEVETLPYIHVSSVSFSSGGSAVTQLALETGDTPTAVTAVFNPANASNTRFRVNVSNRHIVAVSNITETGFSLTGMSAGTATVTITTADGAKTASLTVTVTDSE